MNSGIDMRLAADEKKLDAEGVGADEKHGDQQKPQGQYHFRIIPAADDPYDGVRGKENDGQADERDPDGDVLDLLHELQRPFIVPVEYFT